MSVLPVVSARSGVRSVKAFCILFICSLFNDAVNSSGVERQDDEWVINWKEYGMKRSCFNLRYYPDICRQGLRRNKKSLSQDTRSSRRDLNPGSPECGVLTTRPRRSMCACSLRKCDCGLLRYDTRPVQYETSQLIYLICCNIILKSMPISPKLSVPE
jgi:hypothetical protein